MNPSIRSNLAHIRLKKGPWYSGRWLILLIFLAGYLLSFSKLDGYEIKYALLTIACISACYLLINNIHQPLDKPPLLLLFGIFILFFVQSYWIALFPAITEDFWFSHLRWIAYSPEVLYKTFALISYSFITFCITSYIMLRKPLYSRTNTFSKQFDYNKVVLILIPLIIILMVFTSYIMYATGICRMGEETVYLPLRLAGFIFHIRLTLLPALIILLIWCSDKSGDKKRFILGITLLILHGFSDSLLRSSRGSLFILFILLTLFLLITGRFNKQRVGLTIIVLLLTIFLWPVISSYRHVRKADYTKPIKSSLFEAVDDMSYGETTYAEKTIIAIESIIFRYGMHDLLPIIASEPEPLGIRAINTSVVNFYTHDVLGYSTDHIHTSGTSFIGWFYLVGRYPFVIIGICIFTALAWILWSAISNMQLLSEPVAKAMYLLYILELCSGGSLDRIHLYTLVLIGSIAACEYIMRKSCKRPKLKVIRA